MELDNPNLVLPVAAITPLKEMVVNYIGERLDPEDGDVTVAMAVDVFATEFPEFLLAIAEENFLRGYQQAMNDVENISKE
jgi:hypothetical protein